ncbi:predicted protein [Lichtheimia corymbifera JMRC:FSU:9682]|uniref:Uncharacterized protein n=1 Tax=Lichtheimia corymbifera JMRC:FSU:9682 TaxID=1263082 RepID=A0A068S8H4_9FUNG|nr:predicted protein [Lichtheimia corymbifera JMRC:FSU:9682]
MVNFELLDRYADTHEIESFEWKGKTFQSIPYDVLKRKADEVFGSLQWSAKVDSIKENYLEKKNNRFDSMYTMKMSITVKDCTHEAYGSAAVEGAGSKNIAIQTAMTKAKENAANQCFSSFGNYFRIQGTQPNPLPSPSSQRASSTTIQSPPSRTVPATTDNTPTTIPTFTTTSILTAADNIVPTTPSQPLQQRAVLTAADNIVPTTPSRPKTTPTKASPKASQSPVKSTLPVKTTTKVSPKQTYRSAPQSPVKSTLPVKTTTKVSQKQTSRSEHQPTVPKRMSTRSVKKSETTHVDNRAKNPVTMSTPGKEVTSREHSKVPAKKKHKSTGSSIIDDTKAKGSVKNSVLGWEAADDDFADQEAVRAFMEKRPE